MVIALAHMTPDRIKTMMEALLRMVTNFLTKYCPQKPANTDTNVRYIAAKRSAMTMSKRAYQIVIVFNLFFLQFLLGTLYSVNINLEANLKKSCRVKENYQKEWGIS